LRQLDAPYASDHAQSLVRKGAPPKGLHGLLNWFLIGFREEMPDEIHVRDVWRDYVTEARAPGGGSLLGAPKLSDDFRRFIEGSPFALTVPEYEGHRDAYPSYATPMRAAIARLGGRGKASDERPFMARVMWRTAFCDGDWDAACASFGILESVRRVYMEAALARLWRLYRDEPDAQPISDEAAA
jgi:hypothetical protein